MMDEIQKRLLAEVADLHGVPEGAYNIRANGQMAARNTTANIDIVNISAAEEAGMTESDYFRLLITQQPSDYPEIRGGIKVLINEVNRIGVNINEIVFNNNSNLYRTADKERLIAYMRRLNETLAKVVDDCGYH